MLQANSDTDLPTMQRCIALAKPSAGERLYLIARCMRPSNVALKAPMQFNAIREARIGKVVYGLRSPLMGGYSRWNILSDAKLSTVFPKFSCRHPKSYRDSCKMRWKPSSTSGIR